jgi:peptidoglycan/xylan/chitin deacetylase (PgdA/CDA1 family)
MLKLSACFLLFCFIRSAFPQDAKEFSNAAFLKKLNSDKYYSELKSEIVSGFAHTPAGQWGEFVNGVDELLLTEKKVIAFTFDACGGKNGNGYDKELIDFLQKEKIPATLFVSGRWIDSHFSVFLNLCSDSLFEIENHGLNHRPCSIDGKMIYGIKGTSNIGEAFDEVEANARKIEAITKHRPRLYRSATAYMDEACAGMAARLGIIPVSYRVLSGDAVPFTPEQVIEENVVKNVVPGAIVIMHFNHPDWNTKEAMEKIVPRLREMGYSFVLLKKFQLISINNKLKGKLILKAGTDSKKAK